VYEGQWHEGMPHGEGKCTYADGTIYHGMLDRAVCQGKGLYMAVNGNKILADFEAGSTSCTGYEC